VRYVVERHWENWTEGPLEEEGVGGGDGSEDAVEEVEDLREEVLSMGLGAKEFEQVIQASE